MRRFDALYIDWGQSNKSRYYPNCDERLGNVCRSNTFSGKAWEICHNCGWEGKLFSIDVD